jgi:hypothetical protein
MIPVIIALLLCVLLYSVNKFKSDMQEKDSELAKVGGIKVKYQHLLENLYTFDKRENFQVLLDKLNNYEFGWVGSSTISKFWLNEVHEYLYVVFTIKLNETTLKQHNINNNALPKLDKRLEWKFPTGISQNEMYNTIIEDINSMMEEIGA